MMFSHYEAYTLLTAIDTGAQRPLDEVRRTRRLSAYIATTIGPFFDAMEDIALTYRLEREKVPVIPQDEWRVQMNRLNRAEEVAVLALIDKYADEPPVTLKIEGADLAAVRKWWKEISAFPSKGPMALAALAVDDAIRETKKADVDEKEVVEA